MVESCMKHSASQPKIPPLSHDHWLLQRGRSSTLLLDLWSSEVSKWLPQRKHSETWPYSHHICYCFCYYNYKVNFRYIVGNCWKLQSSLYVGKLELTWFCWLQGNIQILTAADLDKYRAHAWLLSPPCQPYTRQGLSSDFVIYFL